MKKRVICLLLSLSLMAGLFAGMGATAFADGDTWEYTVVSGDYVSKICNENGINFAANAEWIQKTNKLNAAFTISPGMKLILPVAGKVLTYVAPSSAPVTTPSTPSTTPVTTTTSSGVATVQYTLKSGDFVINVCKALGIDFAANEEWIKAANGITGFNNLKAGRVLTLPAPGTTPALSTATASGGVAATSLAATTTTTTAAAGLLAGDTVAYYLYNYSVKSGDTLSAICQACGADMATVQSINKIANAARLQVGQTLKIPMTVAPTGGSYVKVVAHKVVSGETMRGICNRYGISYEANANTIKGLNNRDNLDRIQVGQTVLIPVPSTVATATAGTATAATTTAAATTTTTGVQYYALNTNPASCVGGTYALTVGGQSVNSASAGQTVHIVTMPDHGKKVDKISVVKNYNNAAVAVDANNNFVMPACDVRVAVTFIDDPKTSPKAIMTSKVNAVAGLTYIVNGYTATTAEPGKTVSIVLPTLPSGMVVDKVYVNTVNPQLVAQFTNGTIEAKYFVSVASNLSFVMPSDPVYITVLLKGA